jgi:hypothetical protein
MKLWWCVECQAKVGLGRHGQCEVCESQAVDLISSDGELSHSAAKGHKQSDAAQGCDWT